MTPLHSLLPFPPLQLETIQVSAAQVQVALTTTSPSVCCPFCQYPSRRVHSHYPRTVADFPWAGLAVRCRLTVRKFFCGNPACPYKIFAERLDPVAARYARRTRRLAATLRDLVLTIGGQSGARVAQTQGMPLSARTLLRLAQNSPPPTPGAVRVIGIDDWAWRKGTRYGTIIVDLEARRPIALLEDRTAATVAAWLSQHPEVEIISRDRAGAYAEGATQGCPTALQVADRFHLVKNLVEALEKVFLRKRPLLQSLAKPLLASAGTAEPVTAPAFRPVPAADPVARTTAVEAASQARHAHVVAAYQQVQELGAKKVDVANIARQVGLSRRTVYRYLALAAPPPRRRLYKPQTHQLDSYKPYILTRWNEGCRSARQIWREIQAQGYPESATTVSRFVAQLRHDSGKVRSFKAVGAAAIYHSTAEREHRPLTARQAARLLVTKAAARLAWQTAYLERLATADAETQQIRQLVEGFMQMVRERQGQALADWLPSAEASASPELQTFAAGLRKDYAAVAAGLTVEWSNGQTEAQVGRLKLLKRAMYGQADLPLLRQRVLYRPTTIRIMHHRAPTNTPLAT